MTDFEADPDCKVKHPEPRWFCKRLQLQPVYRPRMCPSNSPRFASAATSDLVDRTKAAVKSGE
ncbi:hypothetical protein [Pseudophaeobacter profundi]|uniref:hypothetical protein n=1 Tax=Pseudophaeobacter profundi TaxID=3034152 RepID=UPI00242B344B|nr:hypothetical protein [Pseudophaeobacter profundi]